MSELLLVDDEAGLRQGLTTVLRMRGHVVHAAENVTQAREALMRNRIELLLTDFTLPDGDGLRLVQEARARMPSLPVLLMTGHVTPDVDVAFATLPHARLITKPARPGEVSRLVDELLAGTTSATRTTDLDTLETEERLALRARLAGAATDTCDRVALCAYAARQCGGTPDITLADEGHLLRVEARWVPAQSPRLDAARWILDLLGGDVQVDGDGLGFRVGLPRDGRPENEGVVDLRDFRPGTRAEISERARSGSAFCNAAPWVRLLAELVGEPRLATPRGPARGTLPADLATLWK